MRRKLINYEIFEAIEHGSLSHAESELVEASDVLATSLNRSPLFFSFFDKDKVIYETSDGTYIHANYVLTDDSLLLENITELVIDEASVKQHTREIVSKLVEAIIDGNQTEATFQFDAFTQNYLKNKRFKERYVTEAMKTPAGKVGHMPKMASDHAAPNRNHYSGAMNKPNAKKPSYKKAGASFKGAELEQKYKTGKNDSKGKHNEFTYKAGKRTMREWYTLAQNVADYVRFVNTGMTLNESDIRTNELGDVVSVRIPTSYLRNEGKILQLQYKVLKTDCKILRESALALAMKRDFCNAVSHIKRLNNMSHNEELEESLSNLVNAYPNVLYVTQNELAKIIGEALNNSNVTNYDDQMCSFMAEGILNVAYNTYPDKVNRIVSLANAIIPENAEDGYTAFQNVVRDFYPKLDESFATEMRVFKDLYDAVVDIRKVALEANNQNVRSEAMSILEELEPILNGSAAPNLDLAYNVASWLYDLTEGIVDMGTTSDSEVKNWMAPKVPYETESGDVPSVHKWASTPYQPTQNTGNWGASLPVSDGKNYRDGKGAEEMTNRSWANKGGPNVYPDLENPYQPKNDTDNWTVKGEPGVNVAYEDGLAQVQPDSSTWPALQNPYIIPSKPASDWKVSDDNRVI